MYHMKQATVRDLRYHFPEIEHALAEGQEIQITKRKRVIGRLVPERPASPPQLPDFMARLREIYGDKKLKVTGAQRIREERDERY
jgi:antitoxin (DNA-binding transcriptional repressor) of toxin-antitoxin stability system